MEKQIEERTLEDDRYIYYLESGRIFHKKRNCFLEQTINKNDSYSVSIYITKNVYRKRPIHLILMEKFIGRNLTKNEHVIHINHNNYCNHIDNLKIVSRLGMNEHKKKLVEREKENQKRIEKYLLDGIIDDSNFELQYLIRPSHTN